MYSPYASMAWMWSNNKILFQQMSEGKQLLGTEYL